MRINILKREAVSAVIFTAAMLAAPTGIASAAPADEEGRFAHGQKGLVSFFIENKEALGLGEDQMNRLKSIRAEFRKTSARIGADIQTAQEAFHDEMQKDEIKMPAIEAASKRIEALESERRIEFAKAIGEGKKVLTKDQLTKAKELRQKSMRPAPSGKKSPHDS